MPHTMARMGDVLAGFHAAWELESDSVLIRFERGIRTPKLFQALGERRIPLDAIAAVTLTPGKRGTVVLRAEPRPGADPLMEAAAGQLKDVSDPYRLVLPAERETRLLKFEPEADTTINGTFTHDVWEEVFILEGEIHDIPLNQTFTKGMYACRPPGMKHGPWTSKGGAVTFETRFPPPGQVEQ
jgi:hypothetical protein